LNPIRVRTVATTALTIL